MKRISAIKSCAIFMMFSVIIVILSLIIFINFKNESSYTETIEDIHPSYPVVVIDAGHGYPDGGCVGLDGTQEKDINLNIATKLYSMLQLANIPCIMTREDDELLYDYYNDLDDYTGMKKIYDVKNRLKIAESYTNPIFISIHMNAFPDSKYSGLQVYYSGNDTNSIKLAQQIQALTQNHLQYENNRTIKCADSSIFILDRIQCPAVLVECGFLSNVEECEKLSDKDYQSELSSILFSSIINFINDYINQV